jgi:hypothetical protein
MSRSDGDRGRHELDRPRQDLGVGAADPRDEREPVEGLDPAQLLLDLPLGRVQALLGLHEQLELLVELHVLPLEVLGTHGFAYRAQSTTV